ncbi:hypothetical protein [Stieleria maiorica]|uniref:hypothetical protein n=1 Tax=Stieleria maiorica TaxID=2795974 RepID=UPI00142F32BE|nr:hypothetical protein [Stieleria maiorica]
MHDWQGITKQDGPAAQLSPQIGHIELVGFGGKIASEAVGRSGRRQGFRRINKETGTLGEFRDPKTKLRRHTSVNRITEHTQIFGSIDERRRTCEPTKFGHRRIGPTLEMMASSLDIVTTPAGHFKVRPGLVTNSPGVCALPLVFSQWTFHDDDQNKDECARTAR